MKPTDPPRPAPDRLQIGAMTVLLALATLPLLPHLAWPVGLTMCVLLGLRAAAWRWPAFTPNRWTLVLLALGATTVVAVAYRALAGQEAGTALLLTMLALKALETRRARDLWVLALSFSFLLVIAFLFVDTALFAFYLIALLIGSFALLADLSVPRPGARRGRDAGRLALRLALQAAPFALLLFVLFPRLDAPLWSLGLDEKTGISGVSDTLELGHLGELALSDALAFHARFAQPLTLDPARLYWRGPVLWRTDGRRWERAPAEFYAVAAPPELVAEDAPLTYRIVMEPTRQRWLFALDWPLAAPPGARLLPDGMLLAETPAHEVKGYELTSAPRYRVLGLSAAERQLALAVPRAITSRMRALVADWRHASADDTAVVARALRYFNEEPFYYTLKPPPLGANPVDEFLFERRAGYCEHYASSFVVLMRLAGIPARIVLGYLGAEYNPLGGHYLVRQADAHAWAEVWLADRGWTRVDPTAALAPERVDRDAHLAALGANAPLRFRVAADSGLGRLLHGARLLVDAFDAGWKNWVVGYSSERQRRLLETVGLAALREYGLVLGLTLGGAAFLLALHLLLARPARAADPIARGYARLCRRLARLGVPRRAAEGPRDYLLRAANARPELATRLGGLLALYLPLRFGGDTDPGRRAAFLRAVRTMPGHWPRWPRRSVRQRRGR